MTVSPEFLDRRLSDQGLPPGGITGQGLTKATDTDYDATWADVVPADGSVTAAKIAAGAVTNAALADDSVTSAKIALGAIVNLDVATNAGILVTKLAAGTAGQILQTNATPAPNWVTVTGDVTISNTGVTSIAAGAVTAADLATATGEVAGVWNSGTSNTGFTNVTGGNLSWRYLKIGKTVQLRAWFTAGTATAASFVEFTLPASLSMQSARATFFNAANGTTIVAAFIPAGTPTKLRLTNSTAAANFTAGATLTNLQVNGTLEVD